MKYPSSTLAAIALAGLTSTSAFAATGYTIGDDSNWLRIGGNIQIDSATFDGANNDADGFPSGTSIRRAELDLKGGMGDNWYYRLQFDMGAGNANNVTLKDAYVGYKNLWHNLDLRLGQLSLPFGFEDSIGSTNTFFMERSLMNVATDAGRGVGLYGNIEHNKLVVMGGFFAPDDNTTQVGGATTTGSDPLTTDFRAIYAPINEEHRVLHLGADMNYTDTHRRNTVTFSTAPELRARSTTSLSSTALSNVQSYQMYGVEMAYKNKSFSSISEYHHVHVERNANGGGDVSFKGYTVMAAYVLTGEERSYDTRYGSFGGVKPTHKGGAWEIGARYSMANLNDRGNGNTYVGDGTQHNLTLGVSWYYNENLRVMGNYIRINKENNVDLDAVGLRAQFVF